MHKSSKSTADEVFVERRFHTYIWLFKQNKRTKQKSSKFAARGIPKSALKGQQRETGFIRVEDVDARERNAAVWNVY